MKVIVYQSFVGPPPPAWLSACMQTAKAWALHKGYDYSDDLDLFQFVPGWFREKAGPLINVVADLALLEMARHFLDKGYDRAIWLDADVVIFDREGFEVDLEPPFLLCEELWLDTDEDVDLGAGPLHCNRQVTNAVTMFSAGNPFLDFYIEKALAVVKNTPGQAKRVSIGTQLLTDLVKTMELPLQRQLGLFSPILKHGLVEGIPEILDLYAAAMTSPVYAANLCFCHRGMRRKGILVDDALFERTLDVLLRGRGAEFNDRYFGRIK